METEQLDELSSAVHMEVHCQKHRQTRMCSTRENMTAKRLQQTPAPQNCFISLHCHREALAAYTIRESITNSRNSNDRVLTESASNSRDRRSKADFEIE